MSTLEDTVPSRHVLRDLLVKLANSQSDFDSLFVDHFPVEYSRVSQTAELHARITGYFQLGVEVALWDVLRQRYPEFLARNASLWAPGNWTAATTPERAALDRKHRELLRDREALIRFSAGPSAIGAVDAQLREVRVQLHKTFSLSKGQVLGTRYELMTPLGSGGMAEVWLANDYGSERGLAPPRSVALKVLHAHYNQRSERERFCRGANVMRQLRHPNIVQVLSDAEESDGRIFFPMEFLAGGTLHTKVLTEQLQHSACLTWFEQIGRALQFAHEAIIVCNGNRSQGLIHRDIAPKNVLFSVDGIAYLSDFDMVLIPDCSTQNGLHAPGTWRYAAPEAFNEGSSAKLDFRADIYSLALTLLFSISRQEFGPLDRSQKISQMIADLPVNSGVKGIFVKALAENRDTRYGSVAELVQAFVGAFSTVTSPPRSRSVPASQPSHPDLPRPALTQAQGPAAVSMIAPPASAAPGPTSAATVPAVAAAQASAKRQVALLNPPKVPEELVLSPAAAVTSPGALLPPAHRTGNTTATKPTPHQANTGGASLRQTGGSAPNPVTPTSSGQPMHRAEPRTPSPATPSAAVVAAVAPMSARARWPIALVVSALLGTAGVLGRHVPAGTASPPAGKQAPGAGMASPARPPSPGPSTSLPASPSLTEAKPPAETLPSTPAGATSTSPLLKDRVPNTPARSEAPPTLATAATAAPVLPPPAPPIGGVVPGESGRKSPVDVHPPKPNEGESAPAATLGAVTPALVRGFGWASDAKADSAKRARRRGLTKPSHAVATAAPKATPPASAVSTSPPGMCPVRAETQHVSFTEKAKLPRATALTDLALQPDTSGLGTQNWLQTLYRNPRHTLIDSNFSMLPLQPVYTSEEAARKNSNEVKAKVDAIDLCGCVCQQPGYLTPESPRFVVARLYFSIRDNGISAEVTEPPSQGYSSQLTVPINRSHQLPRSCVIDTVRKKIPVLPSPLMPQRIERSVSCYSWPSLTPVCKIGS